MHERKSLTSDKMEMTVDGYVQVRLRTRYDRVRICQNCQPVER